MGLAELFPGVSGGTIAFVSGIYHRMVANIVRLIPSSLVQLPKLGVFRWWRQYDLGFMFSLFGGMAISIFIFSNVVEFLLINQKIGIFAFFFGLIFSAVTVLCKQISSFNLLNVGMILLGVSSTLLLTHFSFPEFFGMSPISFFIAGSVAVVAWILPGVSGSLALLSFGLYPSVIKALTDLNWSLLAPLAGGSLFGVYFFANAIRSLLIRFPNSTFSFLVGLMLGSLKTVWPWQITISYQITPEGAQYPIFLEPVSPLIYSEYTGSDPQFLTALLAFFVGIIVLLLLDRLNSLANDSFENND